MIPDMKTPNLVIFVLSCDKTRFGQVRSGFLPSKLIEAQNMAQFLDLDSFLESSPSQSETICNGCLFAVFLYLFLFFLIINLKALRHHNLDAENIKAIKRFL